MQESNSAMALAFLLALVFIYIVLASQFESFLHPVTIMMTTLPLAAVGAIVGVFLSGTTLAMGSFIGIIFLLGLVTKNAILVVDRAIVARARSRRDPAAGDPRGRSGAAPSHPHDQRRDGARHAPHGAR